MSKSAVTEAESRILSALGKRDDTANALVNQLKFMGSAVVEEALWNLLDRNEIEYTKDWKLRKARQLVAA